MWDCNCAELDALQSVTTLVMALNSTYISPFAKSKTCTSFVTSVSYRNYQQRLPHLQSLLPPRALSHVSPVSCFRHHYAILHLRLSLRQASTSLFSENRSCFQDLPNRLSSCFSSPVQRSSALLTRAITSVGSLKMTPKAPNAMSTIRKVMENSVEDF